MSDDGYGKYRKMLKMGIPRQQVNASMLMDGKDPSKFSEQDPNEASAAAGESAGLDLTPKGDQYDKYRKMLKCGLPMGAALQAMAKDGVDPKGFDVSGGGSSSAPAEAAPAPPATAAESESSSDGGGGGGFLSELKTKAEKRGGSSSASKPASSSKPSPVAAKPALAKPVTPPTTASKPAPLSGSSPSPILTPQKQVIAIPPPIPKVEVSPPKPTIASSPSPPAVNTQTEPVKVTPDVHGVMPTPKQVIPIPVTPPMTEMVAPVKQVIPIPAPKTEAKQVIPVPEPVDVKQIDVPTEIVGSDHSSLKSDDDVETVCRKEDPPSVTETKEECKVEEKLPSPKAITTAPGENIAISSPVATSKTLSGELNKISPTTVAATDEPKFSSASRGETTKKWEIPASKSTPIVPNAKSGPIVPIPVKPSSSSVPLPRGTTSAPSSSAMDEVLDQVLEDNKPEPVATSATSANSPTNITNSPQTSGSGKKWTPPAKVANANSTNPNDWKGLFAANKIAVPAKTTPNTEPAAAVQREAEDSHRMELSSVTSAAAASKPAAASPPAPIVAKPAVTSAPSPTLNTMKPAVTSASAPPPVISKPVPVVASAPTSSVPFKTSSAAPPPAKPGTTLKKRHSNDWKAMLAPHMGPPAATAASAAKPEVAQPVTAKIEEKPTPPSSVEPPKVNSVGLNRAADKRLPAWAVVEKPSFLVNAVTEPKISAPKAATTPSSLPVNGSSTSVAASKPVVALPPSQPAPSAVNIKTQTAVKEPARRSTALFPKDSSASSPGSNEDKETEKRFVEYSCCRAARPRWYRHCICTRN